MRKREKEKEIARARERERERERAAPRGGGGKYYGPGGHNGRHLVAVMVVDVVVEEGDGERIGGVQCMRVQCMRDL